MDERQLLIRAGAFLCAPDLRSTDQPVTRGFGDEMIQAICRTRLPILLSQKTRQHRYRVRGISPLNTAYLRGLPRKSPQATSFAW